jgi:hypothetical protein
MTNLSFKEIEKGGHSGETGRKMLCVTNQASWDQLWATHTSRTYPKQAAPAIDFSKEMVIALFAGTVSRGGHSISVENIEYDGKSVIVTYSEKSPAGGGMATVMSQPFHIVRVPATGKPVAFQRDLGPAGKKSTIVDDQGDVIAEQG